MRAETRPLMAPWERGVSLVKVVLKTLSRQMSKISSSGEKKKDCKNIVYNLHLYIWVCPAGRFNKNKKK
jgi:hypothetical protein